MTPGDLPVRPRWLTEGLELADLRRLLTRADPVVLAQGGVEVTLRRLFGFEAAPSDDGEADFPVAALSLYADSGHPPQGYWLRADPVHIRTGQDRLFMGGDEALDIGADEAEALCTALNRHFSADGLMLVAPAPGRWYFRWPMPPEVGFPPLPEILGDDLFRHMPGGEAGRPWRQLLNEIQMLMHADPVNQQRREQGRPEISGVWIWGGGALPQSAGESPFRTVWSDDPLVRGLALQTGGTPEDPPDDAGQWLSRAGPGTHLVHCGGLRGLLRRGELETWQARLQALQRQWIAPLRVALARGEIEQLVISPASAVEYHVTRRRLRRWWRRDRPLTAFD